MRKTLIHQINNILKSYNNIDNKKELNNKYLINT